MINLVLPVHLGHSGPEAPSGVPEFTGARACAQVCGCASVCACVGVGGARSILRYSDGSLQVGCMVGPTFLYLMVTTSKHRFVMSSSVEGTMS